MGKFSHTHVVALGLKGRGLFFGKDVLFDFPDKTLLSGVKLEAFGVCTYPVRDLLVFL